MDCLKDNIKSDLMQGIKPAVKRENEIFIPFTDSKDRNKTYGLAQSKVKQINKAYNSKVFGEAVSLNTSYSDGIGINIHVPKALRNAYDYRQEKKELEEVKQQALKQQIEDAKRAGLEYDEDYLFQKNSELQSVVYTKEVKEALLKVNFNQNVTKSDIDKLPINTKAKQYLKFVIDKNKNIKTYSDLVNTVYNSKFKNEYYTLFTQQVNPKLEKKLIDFLKQFHFDIEETTLNKLKQEFGLNILGVTDIINKTIKVVSKDERNVLTLPEEIAHAVFELLGSNYKNSEIGQQLFKTVSAWEGYKTIYNEYSNIYKDAEGNVDWKKVQKEAIGKALAMAMIDYNSQSFIKLPTDVKILLEKIVNLIRQLLGLSYKDAIKLEKNIKFKDLINEIAGNVLNNNLDYFKIYNDEGFTTTDYLETIQEQNKEDGGKAVKLMQLISKNNGAITGSLSLRKVSQLKRSKEGLLHDIDTYFNSQDLFGLPITRKLTQEEFENTELFSDLQNEYGDSLNYFANWFHEGENYNALHYYITNPEIDKKFKVGKEKGLRLSDIYESLSLAEQKETILIDFFIEPKQVKVIHDDVYNINLTTPEYSYLPKLFVMGRNKDVYDYQNLKYFDNKFKIDDNRNYMFQLSQDESIPSQDTSFDPKEESDVDEFVDDEFNFDDLAAEYATSQEQKQTQEEPGLETDDTLDDEVITNFDKVLNYKKSLKSKIKDRIANVQNLIKNAETKEEALSFARKENQLQERLDQLENDIADTESGYSYGKLKFQAQQDLQRLQTLLQSENVNDINEAKRIINFYKAMSFTAKKVTLDNDPINSHPIFFEEEIFDADGKMQLPQQTIDFFENLSKAFSGYENQLDQKQKRALENIINSHPTIKELYTEELTYKHLTNPTNDISWVDMMIMDPSKNVSSSNLIPQIMMDITQRIFAEKISKAKAFEEKHNKALTKAEKALKAMGQVLSVLGLSNNASFDIFFQKSMGRNTGRLVNRYNQEFFDARASMQADFKEKLKLIRVSGLDDKVKNKLLKETYQERQEWFRENVVVFDVRRLREIREAFPDLADEYFDIVDDAHRKELIENLGSEQAYKEEVDKQIKQIKKYFLWRESNREMAFEENGVSTFEELSPEVQSDILFNEAAKSPFTGSDYYHYGDVQVGDKFVNTSMEYNISIPRRYKTTSVSQNKQGRYVANVSGESTGYYDKKFEQIEKNKDLYEYYKIVQEQMTTIVNSFPADVQDQVFINSLPATRKGFREMLADPNISLYKKLWNALVDFYDRIKGGFGINPQSSISFENEDVITGKVEPTVNAEFLTNNKSKIDNLLTMELIKANNLMKSSGSNLKVKKTGTLDLYKLPQSVIKLISEKTNLPPTYEAIKAKYGERVPVGKILENSVMADIIQDSSTDLPKLIRYYNMMAAEYSARQELLPYMEMMKNHYTQIQTPKTNKQGAGVTNIFSQAAQTDGVRTRANTQMEDWFNRVILGNRDVKAFGVIDSQNVDPKTAMERIGNLISGRILNKKERELNKQLNDLINNTKDQNEIDKLLKIKAGLGKQVSASAAFENLFNYIRYLGLGYNLSSGITNYMEGQIANMIIAATGDHFEPHHYYRALNIVKGSLFKSITGNTKLSTQGSRKLRVLVDRYNILQDSTNELQKASVKTSLDVLDKLGPMEINKRTEYLNQTPLMISVMLSTEITGLNGEKVNAWDAMDMDGRLLPNFRTEENIKNWEEGQGEMFTSFKTKTSQAIGMAHGLGYDNLRGMMAKSSTLGKALTMFKTWAGAQYYTRFATERDDAELGVKGYKGRYLSHTKSSLSIMTSIVGWGFAGPMGAVVTGAAGFAIGHLVGKKTGVRSNLSILGEYAFLLKALARKMIGMPVNFVGSTFTGKQVMNEFVGYEKLIKEGKLGEGKFTERDMKNMRALVTEMSLQIAWIAMALIAKKMFWDDDDEEDSPERIAHNLIVNRSLQLLSSSNMYLTPDGFTQLVGEQGTIRFYNDVVKFISSTQEWIEGNDTITRGVNAGDSKTANAFYKIALPSAVRDSYFGFSKQMERQFEKTTYDDWYFDDTKKTNKRLEAQRLLLKKELEEQGLPEKQITKIVNKRLPLLKDIKDSDSKK